MQMALDGDFQTETDGRPRAFQSVFSTAIASVTDVCERLGLVEADATPEELPEDPDRELWASISSDVCAGAENAAFAAGLHHQAAAELDDIARELASIKSLLDASGRHRG
jgi:hypothetical protein